MNTIKFLNYLIQNKNNLKIKTLTDLTINDGTQYLNSPSNEDNSRDEATLDQLLLWSKTIPTDCHIPKKTIKAYNKAPTEKHVGAI
ncbi:hypothetical protein [Lysinibacillus xylanilyticus]|uniref:hypothetical protein n=1 Tax=Lysinibacillus xylanilyticus TaxID=582475 RepID=UPI003D023EA3